ncbi:UNKNOWN [Stylonychia lemnae]|uniref:Transmembrane protein n=1 Tax=Stylonychia lemnae TaxID=5949 RepID=A0A078A444_STYLE|nr:UNKNOWN [Stylonychia lemnae]|eukprot:CDW76649.1 UNKNOWN [Stylonychia lemnae]
MEVVANKLRRAEDLDSNDLKYWVTYNFLAFPKEEQDKVKALVERQQWFWRRSMFILPPLFYFSYAIVSYQYRSRLLPNMIICSGICLGFTKLGLYSSNKDMSIYYKELFDKYKDEVLDPQFRGLKLHKQKKIYQIDQKEFTSSKFDDLKAMVMSQMRK